MTTQPDDGGAAFPFVATDISNMSMQTRGMSLRDWFAGQALAGAITQYPSRLTPTAWAMQAYEIADAMLRVRTRKES